eukprot:2979169-Rhodomonas_salina.2
MYNDADTPLRFQIEEDAVGIFRCKPSNGLIMPHCAQLVAFMFCPSEARRYETVRERERDVDADTQTQTQTHTDTHRHTHTQTHTDTHRHTHRHTQTHRHTDTHADTHADALSWWPSAHATMMADFSSSLSC